MLQSAGHIMGFSIQATDGEIGCIEDLYFDDLRWMARYLVVRTGTWLSERRVLISPVSVLRLDWLERRLYVALTCEQVKGSPDIDEEKPVSRQHETDLSAYYGWPIYWNIEPFGFEPVPVAMPWAQPLPPPAKPADGDPHLRSAHEVTGYHIKAQDNPVGHVSDFVFDDDTWEIKLIVADAGKWLHHRLLLLRPQWIESISWAERHLTVRLSVDSIRTSPEFHPAFPLRPGICRTTAPSLRLMHAVRRKRLACSHDFNSDLL